MAENKEKDFPKEVKRDILQIINDSPTLQRIGDNEYRCTKLRFYSLYRICEIAIKMRKDIEEISKGDVVLKALCTDMDSMCEVLAIILCNHLFVSDNLRKFEDVDSVLSYNDKLIKYMKAKIMNSEFDTNQWAAIIIGAFKSIDLGGFFFLMESVSTLTDSITKKRMMSNQTLSSWKEAQSLAMQQTSSKTTPSTP